MTCHVTVFQICHKNTVYLTLINARERSQGRNVLFLHVFVYFILAIKSADYFQKNFEQMLTVLHYLNLIH